MSGYAATASQARQEVKGVRSIRSFRDPLHAGYRFALSVSTRQVRSGLTHSVRHAKAAEPPAFSLILSEAGLRGERIVWRPLRSPLRGVQPRPILARRIYDC